MSETTQIDNKPRRLWSANPHQYGPGKIHIVDEKVDDKTLCGRFLSAIPGSSTAATKATCRICLDAVVRRPEQDRWREESLRKQAELELLRVEENARWQAWYQIYMRSPSWAELRRKVIKRANGTCEGCGDAPAVQAHHLTYKNAGAEFLWELRAVCRACHERTHGVEKHRGEAS